MKKIAPLAFLLFFVTLFTRAQSITVDVNSFGLILVGDTLSMGTGFVIKTKRLIVTCAHVIVDTNNVFYCTGKKNDPRMHKFPLKIVKLLPEYDLALLESYEDLVDRPLMPATDFTFSRLQHLFYLGFDAAGSNKINTNFKVNNAYVSAYGVTFPSDNTKTNNINFIEFSGEGVPGYSGGPVFMDNGKVIALMAQAYFFSTLNGQSILMNRAFSISPIVEFLK